jgi:hypothetical protein
MSTKTTFKRVALVAVAALGFGTLSVAPSTAGEASFRVLSFETAPATATTAASVTAVVKVTGVCNLTNGINNITSTVFIAAIPGTSSLAPNSVTTSNYTGTLTSTNATTAAYAGGSGTTPVWQDGAVLTGAGTNGRCTGYYNTTFTPDVAGSYTVVVASSDGAANISPATWTVVASAPTQKFSTAFINTSASPTTDASSLSFASTTNTIVDAHLTVRQYSSTDATTLATNPISKDVVVAISKGLVSKTNDFFAGAKSVTTAAATAATSDYFVFANGEIGSADLTVTVGGTLVSTKKITFSGPAKTLAAAVTSGQPTWIIPTGTTTLTVTAKDEAGNTATALPTTMTVTSATTTVATATIAAGVVSITGVAAGTSVLTIADSATSSPATSATYTVTVAPLASATLPTLTFDKAEYNAGELMTITIGAAAADNATFAAFTGVPATSVNVVTVKNPFVGGNTGNVALVSGKATWTAYAPITAGPITVTATSSTGSSATAAAVTATATVLTDGVAQAAADAAAEAIDAANAATDAANAAAEAADAATAAAQDAADAVAALSVQVSEQVAELKAQNDALRKQLIALTNLIIKIQKKVKA